MTDSLSCAAPMKIGVIGAKGVGGVQGGIETYCSSFYRHLAPGRFHVTMFVSRQGSKENGVGADRIIHIKAPKIWFLEMPLVSILSVLCARCFGIGTLHVHGIGASISLPLARILGITTVVRYLGPEYTTTKWGPIGRRILRICEQFVAKFADRVVCLNQHLADQFSQATGRTRGIFIVPNGVEPPLSESQTSHKIRELIEFNRPFVLAVGRIVPPKNFHLLIEAFLNSDLPDTSKLLIAGEIDYKGKYGRLIDGLTSGNPRVVMLGSVFGADLASLYRHCNLFVLPSMHEGMSFSLLEAASAGAKIIASDIPANSIVCEGFARLTAVNSVEALSEAMTGEWSRERSADEIRRQVDACRSRHSWPMICREMEPILTARSGLHAGDAGARRLVEEQAP